MDTAQTLAFRKLLTESIKKEASDLHISVGSRPMIRIDGSLHDMEEEDIFTEDSIKSIVESVLSAAERESLEQKRDYVLVKVFDNKIRTKIHFFYQEGFLTLSIRFLSLNPVTLHELNMPQVITKLSALTHGLIIVAGRYGSGRTTLAVSLLEEINRTRVEHILTLERPIEYNLVSNKSIVDQQEVGRDVKSFEDGLASLDDEDVDVLLVSELSSAECTRSVLEHANAGMLVIVIIDTDSANRAIERLIAMFPVQEQDYARQLVTGTLQAVVVQALVPQMGGGRIPVHEILLNNASVRSFILSNRLQQLGNVIASSRAEGMLSFDTELASLVRSQKVSLEHAQEIARSRDVFDSLVKGYIK
ncbi:MAG: ATPase, T2SS/T4P/T4SS family [Patescibacteria group bacterium]